MSDINTFYALKKWKENFLEIVGPKSDLHPPFILVGNKRDLKKAKKINKDEIQKWVENEKIMYFEVSASKATNIDDLFVAVCSKALQYSIDIQSKEKQSGNDQKKHIKEQSTNERKTCCI